LQLLPLAQLARALDDQVLQVNAQGNLAIRDGYVRLKVKQPLYPGKQAPHDLQRVGLQAFQDFLLGQVTGVDQQQAQFLVAHPRARSCRMRTWLALNLRLR